VHNMLYRSCFLAFRQWAALAEGGQGAISIWRQPKLSFWQKGQARLKRRTPGDRRRAFFYWGRVGAWVNKDCRTGSTVMHSGRQAAPRQGPFHTRRPRRPAALPAGVVRQSSAVLPSPQSGQRRTNRENLRDRKEFFQERGNTYALTSAKAIAK
jgi:hypothetical protein